MDGMSYVYVYIYTLYTCASMPVVCVCVYLVSEGGARASSRRHPRRVLPYPNHTYA